MPIYEYESLDPSTACSKCSGHFEALSRLGAPPLAVCPECGARVRRVVSRAHAFSHGNDSAGTAVKSEIRKYEKEGMWSHAAELAEKQSEKKKDKALLERALDNYKKAGYGTASLDKHAVKSKDKN